MPPDDVTVLLDVVNATDPFKQLGLPACGSVVMYCRNANGNVFNTTANVV